MCIKTVIPSLFPFFILSGIINSNLIGRNIKLLQPLGRVCKIPSGSESLLLVGLLAGYPVGAQLITQAYKNGSITKKTARRMLGFCNNAGPAFLFGMLSPLFTRPIIPWIIWGIHILSAFITAFLLPAEEIYSCKISSAPPITFPKALQNATKNIVTVCGWVIVFRIFIGYCTKWLLWCFPEALYALITGLLELANGTLMLSTLSSEGLRFIFAGTTLGFGGLCVAMQTISVTEDLGWGYYFPGKVLHGLLAAIISMILQLMIFKNGNITIITFFVGIAAVIFAALVLLLRRKKVVAFA